MSEQPESRRLRMALKLGSESRASEVRILADSLDPNGWTLCVDGTYTHEQLEELALAWLADQCEFRVWTSDESGPQLFRLWQPGESTEGPVRAATEHTHDTSNRTPQPGRICPECLEERNRRAPWEGPADSWKS